MAYKSGKVEEELETADRAVCVLGGELEQKVDVVIPGTDIFRSVLRIRKVKETPGRYPRKVGVPGKEPIS